MKQTQSIKKNHLFKFLYAKGKQNVSPFFAVYCRKNYQKEPQDTNYLGITVGVKLGNAVTRNQVRRRIKAIYRLAEGDLLCGYHIVVVARNRCATASYSQMEQHLLRQLHQLELALVPQHPPRFQLGRQPYEGKKTPNKGKKKPKPPEKS